MAKLISVSSSSLSKANQILEVLMDLSMLELWWVGLMPTHLQVRPWSWGSKVLPSNPNPPSGEVQPPWDPGEAKNWIGSMSLYALAPKAKLIWGANLQGVEEATLVAKLNFLILIKEEKGGILPPGWIEALTQGLPLSWSTATHPWLLRIAKAFGHKVFEPPGKPDPNGVWLGAPPLGWAGPVLTVESALEHQVLYKADFKAFLASVATDFKEEVFLLYDTLWVDWKPDKVYLPKVRRESRKFYTLRVEQAYRWVGPSILWGNCLVQWAVNGASSGTISKSVQRDSCELVATARLYGDPSPLNLSLDSGTVGHLALSAPSRAVTYVGKDTMLPSMVSDESPEAQIEAARFAYAAGLPVLYQHQINNVKVGPGVAGCCNSTVELVIAGDPITFSVGDFQVDKVTKLFNRAGLLSRCPPRVKVNPGDKPSETVDLEGFEALKAKARELLKGAKD